MDTPAAADPAAGKIIAAQPDVPPLAATDVAASAPQQAANKDAVTADTKPIDDSQPVVPPKPVASGPAATTREAIADNGQLAELKALISDAAHAGAHTRPLLAEKAAAAMAGPMGELAQKIGKPYNLTININLNGQGASIGS